MQLKTISLEKKFPADNNIKVRRCGRNNYHPTVRRGMMFTAPRRVQWRGTGSSSQSQMRSSDLWKTKSFSLGEKEIKIIMEAEFLLASIERMSSRKLESSNEIV